MNQNYEQKFGIHNRFDIEVRDAKTGELKNQAHALNIILNGAWQAMLEWGEWFEWIKFGTGSGTLDPARTTLFTYLGRKTVTDATWGYDIAGRWASMRKQIQITETENVGAVISEVGVGSSDNTTILTHALLRDMNGDPVTITKTSLDIITIYATIYCRIEDAYDPLATISIKRSPPWDNPLIAALCGHPVNDGYTTTGHYSPPDFPNFFYGDCPVAYQQTDSESVYQPARSQLIATKTYDYANKKVTMYVRLPAPNGNHASGIKGIGVMCQPHRYASVQPLTALWLHWPSATHTQSPLTDEAVGNGDGIVTDFATAFPFIKDASVKVDGAAASPTIYTGLPEQTNIRDYMIFWGSEGTHGWKPSDCMFPHSSNNGDVILENPFYASYGIDTMVVSYATVWKSSNKTDWTQVYSTGGATQTYTVDAGDKQSQYWKFTKTGGNALTVTSMNCAALATFKNIKFATPPGLVTAEAVGTGDANEVNFTLDHEPIAGSLTVKLDGNTTVDYTLDGGTVTFNSAPGAGVLVTADYRYACQVTATYATDVIIKDINHVVDLTWVIQLGEYTP